MKPSHHLLGQFPAGRAYSIRWASSVTVTNSFPFDHQSSRNNPHISGPPTVEPHRPAYYGAVHLVTATFVQRRNCLLKFFLRISYEDVASRWFRTVGSGTFEIYLDGSKTLQSSISTSSSCMGPKHHLSTQKRPRSMSRSPVLIVIPLTHGYLQGYLSLLQHLSSFDQGFDT
jgi:hypothetical protein